MKRIFGLAALIIVLILAMFSVPATPAVAGSPDGTEVDHALVARGYPAPVVQAMSLSAKTSVSSDRTLIFDGAAIASCDAVTGEVQTCEVVPDGTAPHGQIPAADLLLVVLSHRIRGDDDRMRFTCSYVWSGIPAYRHEDLLAMSWDGDSFAMVDGAFYKEDHYGGYLVDPVSGAVMTVVTGTASSEPGYARGGPGDVAWYAAFPSAHTPNLIVTELSGFAAVDMEILASGYGASSIDFRYGQSITGGLTLPVNVGSWGAASASGGDA